MLLSAVLLTALALVSPLVAYYGFLFHAHGFNPDFLRIDSCLDAGGSWDYENQKCNRLKDEDKSGLREEENIDTLNPS